MSNWPRPMRIRLMVTSRWKLCLQISRVRKGGKYQKKSSLPIYNNTALEQYDVAEVKVDTNTLEHERDLMAKDTNVTAITEYRKKERNRLSC
eukprot:scaffold1283_cov220-Chaetoceros_neogracile.AAC.2